jgi:nucleoside-diphosphate-sugar epimerase
MKILLTGGAGYIGSAILAELLGRSHQVIVYDRFDGGSTFINTYLNSPNVEFVKGDVRDKAGLSKVMSSADLIIHLAAVVGFPACDKNPYEAQSINVDGTRIVCDLKSINQSLIFASTGSTYGKIEGVCDETTPINPLTLYGRNKAEGEKLIQNVGGVNLRLATLFGISGKTRDDLLINNLMKDAVKNRCITVFQGKAMRTFLDVTEAARCFCLALDNKFEPGETYNVGDDDLNFTKIQIAKFISELTGAHLFSDDYNSDPDARDYMVSYEKIKKIGFKNSKEFIPSLNKIKNYFEVN